MQAALITTSTTTTPGPRGGSGLRVTR